MSRLGRVAAETRASWHGFTRRRTAVFFTFFFPLIVILIFGALVQTDPTGGGLFSEPPGYYVAGYLGVVVLFTPLSRVAHEVARHRDGNRFEKLATTPLTRAEWLLAQAIVNAAVVALASVLVGGLVLLVTDATFAFSLLLLPALVLVVALFCGLGAIIGRLADSQDGVVAASNGVALPLLFLSETFVPPEMLPAWFTPLLDASPLTYFSRVVRAATYPGWEPAVTSPVTGFVGPGALPNLAVLTVLAVAFFVVGAFALPRTD